MKQQFDLKNLTLFARTRQILMIAISLGVASLGLVLFVLVPQLSEIFAVNQTVQEEQVLLTKLRAKAITLETIQTNVLFQKEDKISRALLSKKPLLEFLNSLDSSAQSAQVKVTEIQLNPGRISTTSADIIAGKADLVRNQGGIQTRAAAKQGETEAMDVSATIRGTLTQINTFLRTIENTAPLANITTLKLSEENVATAVGLGEDAREVDTGEQFSAELTITTYFSTYTAASLADSPLPEMNATNLKALEQLDSFVYPAFAREQQIRASNLLDLFQLEVNVETVKQ